MSDDAASEDGEIESLAQEQETKECLRCHMQKPVDDDGFCETCLKAIEQACL